MGMLSLSKSVCSDLLSICPVRWRRDDEEPGRLTTHVLCLVFLTRFDIAGVTCMQMDKVTPNLDRQRSAQHIENLVRLHMDMPGLAGPWRHFLLDDTQVLSIEQAPSVADISPDIMLCIRAIYLQCIHVISFQTCDIRHRGSASFITSGAGRP